jgi:hypothetical protein
MNMKLVLAAGAAVTLLGGSASAAVVISSGSFGSADGVHSTGNQSGASVTGTVGIDGSLVTFSSSQNLAFNGAGEAIIAGPMNNLLVSFTNSYQAVTFNIDAAAAGTFDLVVNGVYGLCCATQNLSKNGQNKFIVAATGGDSISSLNFTFNPTVTNLKQFRVQGSAITASVPEPASWAMMIIGFGGIGAAMRRRRHVSPAEVQI